jgi:hypothetical protein
LIAAGGDIGNVSFTEQPMTVRTNPQDGTVHLVDFKHGGPPPPPHPAPPGKQWHYYFSLGTGGGEWALGDQLQKCDGGKEFWDFAGAITAPILGIPGGIPGVAGGLIVTGGLLNDLNQCAPPG